MSAFQKLGLERSVLLELARELSRLTTPDAALCKVELYHVRMKLASSMIRHLTEEDSAIYPALLQSADQPVRDAVRTLQSETAVFADAFRKYVKRWTSTAIDDDWPTYCEETVAFLDALKRRMLSDERHLISDVTFETCGTSLYGIDRYDHVATEF